MKSFIIDICIYIPFVVIALGAFSAWLDNESEPECHQDRLDEHGNLPIDKDAKPGGAPVVRDGKGMVVHNTSRYYSNPNGKYRG